MRKNLNRVGTCGALILFMMVIACKPTEKISEKKIELLALKKILESYQRANPTKLQSISSRGKIQLTNKQTNYNINGKISIERGKKILISASFLGFEIGRALIQPNEITVYEKLQKTFLKGDFSLASKYLKADFLDYFQLEDLLLGRSLFKVDAKNYVLSTNDDQYNLHSISSKLITNNGIQVNGYSHKLEMDTSFRLKKQTFQHFKGEKISVLLKNWQEVNGAYFPSVISIFINDEAQPVLSIDLKEIKAGSSLVNTPFFIPEGYTERQL